MHNANPEQKIQVVRDVGTRDAPKASAFGRERAGTTGSNNITLTFSRLEDVEYSAKGPNSSGDNLKTNVDSLRSLSKSYNEKVGLFRNVERDQLKEHHRKLECHTVNKCEVERNADCWEDSREVDEKSGSQGDATTRKVEREQDHMSKINEVTGSEEELVSASGDQPTSPHGQTESPKPFENAFCDPRQNQVFHTLTEVQRLRRSAMFTDLTVKVKDQEFRCHKFVLACNSPYFQTLIERAEAKRAEVVSEEGRTDPSDLKDKEKKGDKDSEGEKSAADLEKATGVVGQCAGKGQRPNLEITLLGMKPDIFSKILDFLYCVFDEVVTESSALELLLAADTLQLTYLTRTCANYITTTLSPSNVFDVIGLWDSGCSRLFEPKVVRRSHEVIREHFPSMCQTEEFLTLGRHHMIPLVADSMLHVDNEVLVLQALLRWVQFRPAERSADMTLMLQHIRFPLMTNQELDKLSTVSLLKENTLAVALIEESRAYSAMDYNERLAWPRQNCISRYQFPTRDFILWTADRDKGLHLYSIIDGRHHKVTGFADTVLADNTSGHFSFDSTSSVCCYGTKIFFTGGEFSTDMTWSVDTATGEVKLHAKMPRGRKYHSMVAARGCLYCLGGQDKRGYTVLDSVDAYVMEKDIWVKVGHLSVPAYNMAAVVSGGAIYLVGGADQAGQPLRLVQCFIALRSGLYSAFKIEMSNMPPSLLSPRAVTSGFDGLVYIVCGHGEVYKFEPERRQLSHLTTLKNLGQNPRVRFGLAHVGGCLVVIGGHQLGRAMQEPIRSVCLDIASNTEVRDYSPLLPGDIINTCLSVKLSSNTLNLFE